MDAVEATESEGARWLSNLSPTHTHTHAHLRFVSFLTRLLSPRWIVNRREDSDRLQALAQQAGLGGWRPQINIVPFK